MIIIWLLPVQYQLTIVGILICYESLILPLIVICYIYITTYSSWLFIHSLYELVRCYGDKINYNRLTDEWMCLMMVDILEIDDAVLINVHNLLVMI